MIGKLINTVYDNNSALFTGVNGCYPSVAPIDTAMPVIVYDVLDVEPSPTKEAPTSILDSYTVNIMVFAKKYSDTIEISGRFKSMLDELESGWLGGVNLQSCRYVAQDNDYHEELECHVNTINYKFRVNMQIEADFAYVGLPEVLPIELL